MVARNLEATALTAATISIAHLGPSGTYAEAAAIAVADSLRQRTGQMSVLCPMPSIAQTLRAVAQKTVQIAVAPVENSIEGSVSVTLDTLWTLDQLRIQEALVLPISHALVSEISDLKTIQAVYSHPQALGQCQQWLEQNLPQAQPIPTRSTTEALQHVMVGQPVAAIASQRAAQLYHLPVQAHPINDYPENCTRFWVLSLQPSPGGEHTSLAFSVRSNAPGALVKPLEIFAQRNINLSRIESRPSKRSLGDYVFFVDLEVDAHCVTAQDALNVLDDYTETLKIFGSYPVHYSM